MQCACAILSSVVCPAQQCFSTYVTNGPFFEEKLLSIKCVFLFSLQLFFGNISNSAKN